LEFGTCGDTGFQFSHDHAGLIFLGEDIDAKAGFFGQLVGKIARTLFKKYFAKSPVVINKVEGECLGLKGSKGIYGRIDPYRQKLSRTFHLERFAYRNIQVRDISLACEHS
jgi:hypothetical protein